MALTAPIAVKGSLLKLTANADLSSSTGFQTKSSAVPHTTFVTGQQRSFSTRSINRFSSTLLKKDSLLFWRRASKNCSEHRRRHNAVACESGGEPSRFQVAPNMSMKDVFVVLADRLIEKVATVPTGKRYIVGVAGSPGSGKTTLAQSVTALINSRQTDANLAVSVPMDGFHLYRRQLDQMPDPKEAHARRGSHWTFDPVALLATLKTIREKGQAAVPSFNHGVGDPVEGDIEVKPENRVVIVEGNYLLLDEDHWRDLRDVFDETWFLEVDTDVAMRRVLGRHIKTGKPPDVAAWRISYNDRPNALLIAESASRADLVIPSLDMVVGDGNLQLQD